MLNDHKSTETITLTRESYENVVCQAALEQGYEIGNVAATDRTQIFRVNLRNLSSQNL